MKTIKLGKSMKYFRIIFAIVIAVSFILSAIALNMTYTSASAETAVMDEDNSLSPNKVLDKKEYDIEDVTKELIGNVSVSKSEYLYNLDDSADYIYVEFENSGYAIFLKETMEMMEYSAQGKLDYANHNTRKYYGGPSAYLIKENDYFIDTTTNQSIYMSQESAQLYSKDVREKLAINYSACNAKGAVEYDYSKVNTFSDVTSDCSAVDLNNELLGQKPGLDTSSLIIIPDTTGTYIPNYQYFLHAPRHGWNSTGTCGAVAAQLLLSYHNYYSDRRIIDNRFLNGDATNPNANPNLCADPMSMTSTTLGTRGRREDGSDDANSYFSYVVSKIPANATTSKVKNGIGNILSERNKEISGTINYSLGSKTGGWFFGTLAVNTSGITAEIDAGRPAIILMQQSLGGSDHYVVTYGYSSYTYPGSTDSYSGFITHFGWNSGDINVWINSAWCYSYVTLNINHTHTYSKVGTINGDSCRVESRCTECGHRTDAYINVATNDRYVERTASLPQNDYRYKDYNVLFATAGKKLFQTFGTKDARLYLYDAQDNLLASNDDGGYKLNALISYSVTANTVYKLRVNFYSSTESGKVKLGIMPYNSSLEKYEGVWGPFSPGSLTSGTTYSGAVMLTRYSVKEVGTYTFYTDKGSNAESYTDMYLYLIDPTSTDACLYNDDGASNLQAKITTTLNPGIEYLLITTTYNIQTSGAYQLYFKSV